MKIMRPGLKNPFIRGETFPGASPFTLFIRRAGRYREVMDWQHGDYTMTDDQARVDLRAICTLLGGTYWARERPPEMIERSVRHSLCFSVFHGGEQIGLTRVITDHATFGYLCDVVIDERHRGRGLGKWMLANILAHPDLLGCRIDLFTADAQEFYRAFGFGPHRFTSMVRYPPGYPGGPRPNDPPVREA